MQEVQERKRDFALSEILPQGLTQPVSVRRVIERVVGDLKGGSEMLAEAEESRLLIKRCVADDAADSAGCRNQARGLMFDDSQVFRFRNERVAVVVELQHLALSHFPAGFRQGFIDCLISKPDDLANGFGVQVVTNQDADLVAP